MADVEILEQLAERRVDRCLASDNPFSQQRLERFEYRFQGSDASDGWEASLRRLRQLNFRGTIIGPRGTGKSTLLRSLRDRLIDAKASGQIARHSSPRPARVAAALEQPFESVLLLSVPRLGCEAIGLGGQQQPIRGRQQQVAWLADGLQLADRECLLLIDGVERLAWMTRQRLVRQWAAKANVAGLVVSVHHRRHALPLPAWIATQASVALLEELISELLCDEPASEAAHFVQRGQTLLPSHQDNLRDVLRQLYDEWFERSWR